MGQEFELMLSVLFAQLLCYVLQNKLKYTTLSTYLELHWNVWRQQNNFVTKEKKISKVTFPADF